MGWFRFPKLHHTCVNIVTTWEEMVFVSFHHHDHFTFSFFSVSKILFVSMCDLNYVKMSKSCVFVVASKFFLWIIKEHFKQNCTFYFIVLSNLVSANYSIVQGWVILLFWYNIQEIMIQGFWHFQWIQCYFNTWSDGWLDQTENHGVSLGKCWTTQKWDTQESTDHNWCQEKILLCYNFWYLTLWSFIVIWGKNK